MMFKTSEKAFEGLASFLETEHSYDVPEIVGVPAAKVGDGYAKWMSDLLGY